MVVTVDEDGEAGTPRPFLDTPAQERGPIFSPDGRWVAYVSNQSGQNEVYVRPYPGQVPETTISTGGGQEPVWARDGSELFYRNGQHMLVVQVETQPTFSVERPQVLFEDPYFFDTSLTRGMPSYDIHPDGERFVMVQTRSADNPETTQLNVVLNWFEELKRLVPVP